jgi:hypothetical protein
VYQRETWCPPGMEDMSDHREQRSPNLCPWTKKQKQTTPTHLCEQQGNLNFHDSLCSSDWKYEQKPLGWEMEVPKHGHTHMGSKLTYLKWYRIQHEQLYHYWSQKGGSLNYWQRQQEILPMDTVPPSNTSYSQPNTSSWKAPWNSSQWRKAKRTVINDNY